MRTSTASTGRRSPTGHGRINVCAKVVGYQSFSLIRLPSAATFNLPSGKRGWWCVRLIITHPLVPSF